MFLLVLTLVLFSTIIYYFEGPRLGSTYDPVRYCPWAKPHSTARHHYAQLPPLRYLLAPRHCPLASALSPLPLHCPFTATAPLFTAPSLPPHHCLA